MKIRHDNTVVNPHPLGVCPFCDDQIIGYVEVQLGEIHETFPNYESTSAVKENSKSATYEVTGKYVGVQVEHFCGSALKRSAADADEKSEPEQKLDTGFATVHRRGHYPDSIS